MDFQRQWIDPFNLLVAGLVLVFIASVVMGLLY
jgi:hypothetical protein